MGTPHIRILATGGTIAGSAGSAIGHGYRAGQVAIADMVAGAQALGIAAQLDGIDIAQVGSQDIGWPQWQPLHRHIVEALADEDIDGIIVTHGTDTAEETAMLLDITLPAGKPVVLVGAMRPADAVGSDGLRNFANAVRVAGDPAAHGRGVMLVMGDTVLAASDARKWATANIDAFRGYPRGPLGVVTPATLDWFGPADRTGNPARFAFPDRLPRVEILYAHAGMDEATVGALLRLDPAGMVLAGLGQGNAPRAVLSALAEVVASGRPVVRASRVDEGSVDRNVEVDDDAAGFIASRAYNPQKSRILLQVMLANGITDPARMQAEFDRR
ncbi:MAG: asparaginase [Sphingomonadales bacterium]|nr:asparaginase [Sphingomonadales bacterium]MBD3774644.1 asparaginase [Paracoccaceae bacterium]